MHNSVIEYLKEIPSKLRYEHKKSKRTSRINFNCNILFIIWTFNCACMKNACVLNFGKFLTIGILIGFLSSIYQF